jgi:hypothetical protein
VKIRGSLCAAIFFLLLGLYGIIQSLTFRYWESIVLPAAMSSIIFVMAAVEVSKELHRQGKQEKVKAGTEVKNRIELRRFGLVFGWAAAFMLGIYLLGFLIAVPLFAFTYLKWRGRSWLTAALFAVVMLAFIYGAFELGLKAPLFKGLIFGGR